MPRRSLWKGSFVDAFLMGLKNRKDQLSNKKIWSRRSSVLPEFLNTTVRIYNGRNFIRCKITEDKVGHKFGEFALTRKRRPWGTPKGKNRPTIVGRHTGVAARRNLMLMMAKKEPFD